ncbi:mechanosensitive ion channel family protein [Synechococcus sp. CCY 9618]|uniref:mechanosensitive ion channel family protein n=1 Tax=Synechococcus sp. CCY 9618 TaxID=2815602 RepID=UPI0020B1873C|nr:mechanosensitive ion channel family protein [Synechococcus sp. CCY 9618]
MASATLRRRRVRVLLVALAATILPAAARAETATQRILADVTLMKSIGAVVAVLLAYAGIFLIERLTGWLSEKVARRYRLLIKQSVPFLKGMILIVTVSYLLDQFLNLTQNNLLALTGTLAVALGFAFKDYVSSIIAGVVSLFEASYRVGDRVRIGDHYGEVVGYGLRSLQLVTPDDNTITIPHNLLWTDSISNANSGKLEAQVATDVYFDHTVDPDLVVDILYQAAYSSQYTQLRLPIVVVMEEHLWGTQYRLRCYPMDARDEFVYRTDLLMRAKRAFAHHDLSYPRPQLALLDPAGSSPAEG